LEVGDMPGGNIIADSTVPPTGERFDTLLSFRNLKIERIISSALVIAQEYVQPQDEWVLLLTGQALLRVGERSVPLSSGDHLFLPAGTPHAVEQVSQGAMWLAVHLFPEAEAAAGIGASVR